MIVSFINSKTGEEIARDFLPSVRQIDEGLIEQTVKEFMSQHEGENVEFNQLLDYIHDKLKVCSCCIQTPICKIVY